jgi:enoyl-CoA hydratase
MAFVGSTRHELPNVPAAETPDMIEVCEQGAVTVVRMADGKANVMSIEFCALLAERFAQIGASPASAVVLTGSGRIFSAGVDLLRLLEGGVPYIRKFLPVLSTALATVFACGKPVVAAINGHAIAGGCVLACAADKRLMAREGGRIGVTELLVGVPFPAAALEIMRCAVAPQHFEDVMFSGTTYSPAQAAGRGMVHEIIEPDILVARAIACAETLAALPPSAFALTKRQSRQPSLERLKADATRTEVEQIWTAPETLGRIRDYVARTLHKS